MNDDTLLRFVVFIFLLSTLVNLTLALRYTPKRKRHASVGVSEDAS